MAFEVAWGQHRRRRTAGEVGRDKTTGALQAMLRIWVFVQKAMGSNQGD